MWELVVVSIGKHSTVMGHHLCLPFQNRRLVHSAAAAVLCDPITSGGATLKNLGGPN